MFRTWRRAVVSGQRRMCNVLFPFRFPKSTLRHTLWLNLDTIGNGTVNKCRALSYRIISAFLVATDQEDDVVFELLGTHPNQWSQQKGRIRDKSNVNSGVPTQPGDGMGSVFVLRPTDVDHNNSSQRPFKTIIQ